MKKTKVPTSISLQYLLNEVKKQEQKDKTDQKIIARTEKMI
jgi:hypothetical protein